MNHDDVRLEDEIRAMFAHRSEGVRASYAPYEAVATRIGVARRQRRQRIGGSVLAVMLVAAGVGAWASQNRAVRSAPPAGGLAKTATFEYADKSAIPAESGGADAAMRTAAVDYLTGLGQGRLTEPGHTIVTTFDRSMMAAARRTGDELTAEDVGRLPAGSRIAFVSQDAATGQVKAFYGGAEAFTARVPIGQLIYPVVAAAAIDTGHFTADSMEPATNSKPLHYPIGSTLEKDRIEYVDAQGKTRNWPPAVDDGQGETFSGSVSLAEGVAESISSAICDVEMEPEVTPQKVYDLTTQLGIPGKTGDLAPRPSLCLGPVTLSPAQVAGLYAGFANHGVVVPQQTVTEVLDSAGHVVWTPDPKAPRPQVLQTKTATRMADMLRTALSGGTTADNADMHSFYSHHQDAGGKTATVAEFGASWFAGFDNGLSTAVEVLWPGAPPPQTSTPQPPIKILTYGNQLPATVWARYMNTVDPPQE